MDYDGKRGQTVFAEKSTSKYVARAAFFQVQTALFQGTELAHFRTDLHIMRVNMSRCYLPLHRPKRLRCSWWRSWSYPDAHRIGGASLSLRGGASGATKTSLVPLNMPCEVVLCSMNKQQPTQLWVQTLPVPVARNTQSRYLSFFLSLKLGLKQCVMGQQQFLGHIMGHLGHLQDPCPSRDWSTAADAALKTGNALHSLSTGTTVPSTH